MNGNEPERCRNCGREVHVMCWKNTGYCCEACKEQFEERGVCCADGEQECFCDGQ